MFSLPRILILWNHNDVCTTFSCYANSTHKNHLENQDCVQCNTINYFYNSKKSLSLVTLCTVSQKNQLIIFHREHVNFLLPHCNFPRTMKRTKFLLTKQFIHFFHKQDNFKIVKRLLGIKYSWLMDAEVVRERSNKLQRRYDYVRNLFTT